MDGPKHYTEAEVIAEQAEVALRKGDPDHLATAWVALAQVHATLALAAATAVESDMENASWHEVAGPGSP
jgi:hypothetical protein